MGSIDKTIKAKMISILLKCFIIFIFFIFSFLFFLSVTLVFQVSFRLFTTYRIKSKKNHLYLEIVCILSDCINLHPELVNRQPVKDHKFRKYKGKCLYFVHLNISSRITLYHWKFQCSSNWYFRKHIT